jgi:hypothetical protein
MASRKVDIQISTRSDTTGAKQAEKAIDAVAASTTRVETASTAAATASTKQAAGTSRVGQIASAAGFQVQDFAVQVAGGTSALVAMSQQAPQFLGVFGPGGAIAGALIAVGAIAAKVFLGMRDDSASTAESAALLAEAIEQIGENAGKAVAKDIDFGLAQIDAAATQARALAGAFDGVTAASNAAALTSLANAEKIREAELEISRLRGEQVDEMRNIAANAEAEAAIREEQARQEIEAQNQRLAKAKEEEAAGEELLLQKRSMRIQAQLELQDANALLATLRAQRDEREKQAKARGQFSQGEIPFIGAPGAAEAQRQLDDPAFRTLLSTAEKRVAELEKSLSEKGGALTTGVTNAAMALEQLATRAVATAEEVAIAIPEIERSFQAENIVAQVEGIKEMATQAATQVQGIIDEVKPANAAEAAALEALKPMVADKKITADETLRVSQLLGTLDGAIRTQMGTAAANTQSLIDTIRNMQRTLDSQKLQIERLQSASRGSGN